jgi:hypothetical protein
MGVEGGPLSLMNTIEELLGRNIFLFPFSYVIWYNLLGKFLS